METVIIKLISDYGLIGVVTVLAILVWFLTKQIIKISDNHLTHIEQTGKEVLKAINNLLIEIKEVRSDLKNNKK